MAKLFRVIAWTILRMVHLRSALRSADPTFNDTLASIWMQVQLDHSIMACTVPCLKPFMVACNTGWGRVLAQPSKASTLRSGSYGLRSLQKNLGRKGTQNSQEDAKIEDQYQKDGYGDDDDVTSRKQPRSHIKNESVAISNNRDPNGADETSQSVASNDSQQMIIRREVMWTVTYDDENPRGNGNHHDSNRVDVESQTHPNTL